MIKGQADLNLGEGESITGQDVSDLLNLAIKSKNIGDKEMITVVPVDFTLDLIDDAASKFNFLLNSSHTTIFIVSEPISTLV